MLDSDQTIYAISYAIKSMEPTKVIEMIQDWIEVGFPITEEFRSRIAHAVVPGCSLDTLRAISIFAPCQLFSHTKWIAMFRAQLEKDLIGLQELWQIYLEVVPLALSEERKHTIKMMTELACRISLSLSVRNPALYRAMIRCLIETVPEIVHADDNSIFRRLATTAYVEQARWYLETYRLGPFDKKSRFIFQEHPRATAEALAWYSRDHEIIHDEARVFYLHDPNYHAILIGSSGPCYGLRLAAFQIESIYFYSPTVGFWPDYGAQFHHFDYFLPLSEELLQVRKDDALPFILTRIPQMIADQWPAIYARKKSARSACE